MRQPTIGAALGHNPFGGVALEKALSRLSASRASSLLGRMLSAARASAAARSFRPRPSCSLERSISTAYPRSELSGIACVRSATARSTLDLLTKALARWRSRCTHRTTTNRGGNNKKVSANGCKAGNLHHYWDTEFVALLETDAKSIASDLIGHISKAQEQKWQSGSPVDWAKETFEVAEADAYGLLPEPSARNTYRLTDEYITTV